MGQPKLPTPHTTAEGSPAPFFGGRGSRPTQQKKSALRAARASAESPRNGGAIGRLRRMGRPKLPTPHTSAESSPVFFGSARKPKPVRRASAKQRMATQSRSPGGSARRTDPATKALRAEHRHGFLISPHPNDVKNPYWGGRESQRRGGLGLAATLGRTVRRKSKLADQSRMQAERAKSAEITSSSGGEYSSSREASPQPSPVGGNGGTDYLFPVSQQECDEVKQFFQFINAPVAISTGIL